MTQEIAMLHYGDARLACRGCSMAVCNSGYDSPPDMKVRL